MILITLHYQAVYASTFRPAVYRVSAAGDMFSDTWQIAAGFNLRAPRRIRARHLVLAVGTRFPLPKRAGRLSRAALADPVQS